MMGEFECIERDHCTVVRTPIRYPDGDTIELFVRQQGRGFMLTDYGETFRWLHMQKLGRGLTDNENESIMSICRGLGVTYQDKELSAAASAERLPSVALNLAMCALRVSDLSLGFQYQGGADKFDEFSELLTGWDFEFESRFAVEFGDDEYRVDFKINPTPSVTKYLQILSADSRSQANSQVDRTLAKWLAFEEFGEGPTSSRISVLDDRDFEWSDNRERLLRRRSLVALWSNKSDVKRKIRLAS